MAEDTFATQQYEAIRLYLDSFLQQQRGLAATQQRATAKDKMTRLTKQQFFDLSTDVYDEMNRRQANSNDVPFLPVREDLHPKRNQARQKLATLPSAKFKDLACDVFYEIERRFPFVVTQFENKYGIGGNQNLETSRSASGQNRNTQENTHSLDNLMADIGSLLTHPKGPSDVIGGISPESVEKLRREYDSRIESLQNKVRKLEQELEVRDTEFQRLSNVDEKLATQISINRDLEGRLSAVQHDYSKLKEDFDGLQDDFNNQQQIASDIRSEATNLLEEIKLLSKRNEELMAERNRYVGSNALPTQQQPSGQYGYNHGLQLDDGGIIDRSRVSAYQAAVDDLMRATRSDAPTNILVAMKAIVIACKNITEDTEAFENTTNTLRNEDKDQLEDVKNQLSGALQNLMNCAKNHATNFNSSPPVSLLENAAGSLSGTIEELVRLLKLSQSGSSNSNNAYGNAGNQHQGQWQSRVDNYEIDELKVYLEQQTDLIVQAIQSLLVAMKQNTPVGQEFDDTVRSITDIVYNLVKVSTHTLSKPSAARFRADGEAILKDLSKANIDLEDLGISMLNSPQSKTLKQKLASSSYEIAKFVKELISLIE